MDHLPDDTSESGELFCSISALISWESIFKVHDLQSYQPIRQADPSLGQTHLPIWSLTSLHSILAVQTYLFHEIFVFFLEIQQNNWAFNDISKILGTIHNQISLAPEAWWMHKVCCQAVANKFTMVTWTCENFKLNATRHGMWRFLVSKRLDCLETGKWGKKQTWGMMGSMILWFWKIAVAPTPIERSVRQDLQAWCCSIGTKDGFIWSIVHECSVPMTCELQSSCLFSSTSIQLFWDIAGFFLVAQRFEKPYLQIWNS